MNIKTLASLLNEDLKNEYKHFHFYLHSSHCVQGIERFYLFDFLQKQAKSELEHINEFAHKINSLGVTPTTDVNPFPKGLISSNSILHYAIDMEKEVVNNYHVRRKQAEEVGDVSIVVFLEDQIEDSQNDVDELLIILGKV